MADISQKENSMGTQKMNRLILFTGIPLMVSLFINSLYNFVDSMFISRVSEEALTALSLAAPVQMLVSALCIGFSYCFIMPLHRFSKRFSDDQRHPLD